MYQRRQFLKQSACGFGALATAAMLQSQASATHFAPRAKRIIFLFMQGGVSQIDSFDYKPTLAQRNGEKMPFSDARVLAKTGERSSSHRVMQSPWKFQRYGQSDRWASELFPHIATHMDKLCMIHSMHTEGVAHGPATLFLHCGATNLPRPSFGSWLLYGLGPDNENLPGFISISPSLGNGGPRNYGAAFLDAKYQGTPIGSAEGSDLALPYLNAGAASNPVVRGRFELLQQLNRLQSGRDDSRLEAITESYELAWKMQNVAPEIFDIDRESPETLAAYGIGEKVTDTYGRRCLLARRLCESGVRFVQVNYGDNSANPAWDQHSNLAKHADHAAAVDQPIAALLADLESRGLLEDTLVWWGSEFGRTPYAQDNGTGRDHNPGGFTVWLAGGGVKAGYSHGATDEFGAQSIEKLVHMHDLHATLMHLMGLDHERLTYRYAGRDFRLTDVYGRVVEDIIA